MEREREKEKEKEREREREKGLRSQDGCLATSSTRIPHVEYWIIVSSRLILKKIPVHGCLAEKGKT
jgi:hypothetical protein